MSAETIGGAKKHFAIFSGLCASGASFFGKLTGEAAAVEFELLQQIGVGRSVWLIRAICFALMVLCNAFVWTFYVKALHSTSGTLTATVTSAATNYLVSFILGVFIFGEEVTMYTLMGTSLILVGLFFLTRDADAKKRD